MTMTESITQTAAAMNSVSGTQEFFGRIKALGPVQGKGLAVYFDGADKNGKATVKDWLEIPTGLDTTQVLECAVAAITHNLPVGVALQSDKRTLERMHVYSTA